MSALRNKLLVLNAGSSSLKFKIFEVVNNSGFTTIGSGLCERIGDPANSKMKANKGSDSWRKGDTFTEPLSDHQSALSLLKHWLSDAYSPQFNLEVHSVGHRVVHGGTLTAPTVVRCGLVHVTAQSHTGPVVRPADALLRFWRAAVTGYAGLLRRRATWLPFTTRPTCTASMLPCPPSRTFHT